MFTILSIILQVVPPPPPPPPNGWPGNNPFAPEPCITCIPIDQGAILLIIVGLIIGTYTLIKERYKNRRKW